MTSAAKRTVNTPPAGHVSRVRIMTADERSADIKKFGKEIRQSKESAIAFLQSAGILDDNGELAEPYRS
jgi:hypothetical protein